MWVRSRFDAFIRSLGLRYFEPWEFLVDLDRGSRPPPEHLWPNVTLAATLWDAARRHFRRPATITSAYRDPAYNADVGGRPLSQHQGFSALDGKVRGVSPQHVAAFFREQRGSRIELPVTVERVPYVTPGGEAVPFAPLRTWVEVGGSSSLVKFAGGVGVYDWGVHLDGRGLNHSWGR